MSDTAALTITAVEAVHLRLSEVDAARCDGTQDTLLIFVTASDGTVGVGEVPLDQPGLGVEVDRDVMEQLRVD